MALTLQEKIQRAKQLGIPDDIIQQEIVGGGSGGGAPTTTTPTQPNPRREVYDITRNPLQGPSKQQGQQEGLPGLLGLAATGLGGFLGGTPGTGLAQYGATRLDQILKRGGPATQDIQTGLGLVPTMPKDVEAKISAPTNQLQQLLGGGPLPGSAEGLANLGINPIPEEQFKQETGAAAGNAGLAMMFDLATRKLMSILGSGKKIGRLSTGETAKKTTTATDDIIEKLTKKKAKVSKIPKVREIFDNEMDNLFQETVESGGQSNLEDLYIRKTDADSLAKWARREGLTKVDRAYRSIAKTYADIIKEIEPELVGPMKDYPKLLGLKRIPGAIGNIFKRILPWTIGGEIVRRGVRSGR